MTINGKKLSITKVLCLVIYYSIAYYLPESRNFFRIGGRIRGLLCRHIFLRCGKNVNIERKAWFGSGSKIELGNYSGIGINAHIPSDTIIGKYVMMGPNCLILDVNHNIDDINTPMCFQGISKRRRTIIDDDVWIGRDVKMTPGRHISKGSVIGMGTILTKDFPEFSIVGGAPSKFIRSRKDIYKKI